MTSAAVSREQRWHRSNPCPVCGGWPGLPQGQGRRCHGFLSADGLYAHCSREEYSGAMQPGRDDLYAHLLAGACRCGRQHGANAAPASGINGAKTGKRLAMTTRYEVRDVDGQLVAVHVRRDKPDGSKSFAWARPDGTSGLGGRRVETLPLYGAEKLRELSDGAEVVITEGEKACEALRARGVAALATVTGAHGAPGDEALRPLVHLEPVLWADNDDEGRRHMERIAARLRALGARPRVVAWPDVPPKGDAADFTGSDEEVRDLLDAARPWQAPSGIDLAALLDQVVAFIRRYVVMDARQVDAAALWVAHTHVIEVADVTPYLHVTSAEKRSAKTLLLEVAELLVAKAWPTGRVTAAVLARKVDAEQPTLLLDESDAAFNGDKEYGETLRGILNTGYRRGGAYSCCVGQGANLTYRDFSTFGPKAIAGLGRLPDTVADRCIRIELKRQAPNEKAAKFRRRRVEPEAKLIRRDLERWAVVGAPMLGDAEPEVPDALDDRAGDVWEPLFAIADLAGGDWPQRARSAALSLSAGDGREDDSLGVRLLCDIKAVFEERGVERLPSGELATALQRIEESPWGDLRGKPIDPPGLARRLKPYGVKPKNVRLAHDRQAKGYERADFEDAWRRYMPNQPSHPSQASQSSDSAWAVGTAGTPGTGNPGVGKTDSKGDGLFAEDPVACPECAALIPPPARHSAPLRGKGQQACRVCP